MLKNLFAGFVMLCLFSSNTVAQHDTASHKNQTTSGEDKLMQAMTAMQQDMKSMKTTKDPDHDFAMLMISHHNGAIGMSQAMLKNGNDDQLKQMAQKIIKESKIEIEELKSFHKSHKPAKTFDFTQDAMKVMDASMANHNMTGDINKDFASMMVQHHQHGIKMAKLYLDAGSAEKTKEIARKILQNQPKDIDQLNAWLSAHQ